MFNIFGFNESAPIKIFFLIISLEDLIYYFGGFLLTFGGNFIHENHIYAFKKLWNAFNMVI